MSSGLLFVVTFQQRWALGYVDPDFSAWTRFSQDSWRQLLQNAVSEKQSIIKVEMQLLPSEGEFIVYSHTSHNRQCGHECHNNVDLSKNVRMNYCFKYWVLD